MAEGELDFCISSPPTLDSALQFELLFEERDRAADAAAASARARSAHRCQRSRSAYPIVLTDRGCAYRRSIETALRVHGVTLAARDRSVQHPRDARARPGRAWRSVLSDQGRGSTERRAPPGAAAVSLSLPVGIVSRADHALTPVQQTLRDRLRTRLRR